MLKHKSSSNYDELYQADVDKYTEMGLDEHVQTVVTDSEEIVLREVARIFGHDVNSKRCFYHLTLSTCRKVQSQGLVQL